MKILFIFVMMSLFMIAAFGESMNGIGAGYKIMLISAGDLNKYLKSKTMPEINETPVQSFSFTSRIGSENACLEFDSGASFSSGKVSNSTYSIVPETKYTFLNGIFYLTEASGFKIGPVIGIGFGETALNILEGNVKTFDNAVATTSGAMLSGTVIKKSDTVINAGVSMTTRMAGMMSADIRAGYLIPISSSEWRINNVAVSGGPAFTQAGAYVQFSTGF